MSERNKVLILGAGPAGYTAAIYAARGGLETILLSGEEPGGQLTITTDVENYPGFSEVIQGPWLMEQMMQQSKNVGVNIVNDTALKVELSNKIFRVSGKKESIYEADALIIATGAQAKWLGLESEKKFMGFGVSGCATCDAFFYKNKEVLVVGGGNTAVEEALYLTKHASKVTLIHRRDALRAESIMQKRLFDNEKIKIIWDTVVEEIEGEENPLSVTGVKVKNIKTNEEKILKTDGVFIAIGHKPNTELFKDVLKMDVDGYIVTCPDSTATSIKGIFAAGDVQDKVYRQAVTAAGTGCMAALEAIKYLE